MMPNMDGHKAAKAIRALGIERSDAVTIPIVALSANALDVYKRQDVEHTVFRINTGYYGNTHKSHISEYAHGTVKLPVVTMQMKKNTRYVAE